MVAIEAIAQVSVQWASRLAQPRCAGTSRNFIFVPFLSVLYFVPSQKPGVGNTCAHGFSLLGIFFIFSLILLYFLPPSSEVTASAATLFNLCETKHSRLFLIFPFRSHILTLSIF